MCGVSSSLTGITSTTAGVPVHCPPLHWKPAWQLPQSVDAQAKVGSTCLAAMVDYRPKRHGAVDVLTQAVEPTAGV